MYQKQLSCIAGYSTGVWGQEQLNTCAYKPSIEIVVFAVF